MDRVFQRALGIDVDSTLILACFQSSSTALVLAFMTDMLSGSSWSGSSNTDSRQSSISVFPVTWKNSVLLMSACMYSLTSSSIKSMPKSEVSSIGCFMASKMLNCTRVSPNSIESVPTCTSILVLAIIRNGRPRIKIDVGMTFIEAPKSTMALAKVQSPMVHVIEKILGSRHFFGKACLVPAMRSSFLSGISISTFWNIFSSSSSDSGFLAKSIRLGKGTRMGLACCGGCESASNFDSVLADLGFYNGAACNSLPLLNDTTLAFPLGFGIGCEGSSRFVGNSWLLDANYFMKSSRD
ncbi:hypothetical protein CR513_16623, partial [Mucuna pruriens]